MFWVSLCLSTSTADSTLFYFILLVSLYWPPPPSFPGHITVSQSADSAPCIFEGLLIIHVLFGFLSFHSSDHSVALSCTFCQQNMCKDKWFNVSFLRNMYSTERSVFYALNSVWQADHHHQAQPIKCFSAPAALAFSVVHSHIYTETWTSVDTAGHMLTVSVSLQTTSGLTRTCSRTRTFPPAGEPSKTPQERTTGTFPPAPPSGSTPASLGRPGLSTHRLGHGGTR